MGKDEINETENKELKKNSEGNIERNRDNYISETSKDKNKDNKETKEKKLKKRKYSRSRSRDKFDERSNIILNSLN